MKQKTMFYCTECGNETAKWAGKCPACGAWNTIVEQPEMLRAGAKGGKAGRSPLTARRACPVTELETEEGLVSTYCMYETECLVPLLSLASYLASGNGITNGQNRRSTPVLRGEKWKEMEN